MQFRLRSIFSTFVLALLALSVNARPPQPAPASIDIVLEGPWIYQYYTYNNIPVLIAMAPAVAGHNGPTFTTGPGSKLPDPDVVYALSFDDKPFPYPTSNAQQPPSLISDGYPPLALITAVKMNTKWPQIDPTIHAYYFILPMPNFATNEGEDDMKFGPTFGQYNNAPETHTIGLHLHYLLPISKAVLYQCDHPDLCSNPKSVESQPNYGTLKIIFTADDETDDDEIQCDNHVRLAYHTMMQFLDPGNKGLNGSTYYVDLPGQDDNDLYSPNCYGIDPQNPDISLAMHSRRPLAVNVNAAIQEIVSALKAADPQGKGACGESLGCEKLKTLADARTGKLSPRFDSVLMDDLRESISKIGPAYKQALEDLRAKKTATGNRGSFMNPLLVNLLKAQSLELKLRDIIIYNVKTGKDCKVAQMLLQ